MARGFAANPRAGPGRPKGRLNKSTADVKALAQQYGSDAIDTLAALMVGAEQESARIAAAKELLDRGYGKATQIVAGDEAAPLRVVTRIELVAPGLETKARGV